MNGKDSAAPVRAARVQTSRLQSFIFPHIQPRNSCFSETLLEGVTHQTVPEADKLDELEPPVQEREPDDSGPRWH